MTRLFSNKKRPVHLGPYPLERLERTDELELGDVPRMSELSFHRPDQPESIVNAMTEHQAMMDAIRDGIVNPARATVPTCPKTRADHLKAFGYFSDASMIGTSRLPSSARLERSIRNPDIDRLAHDLKTRQTKTLASGIDTIMAGLKDAIEAPPATSDHHTHAIVFLHEFLRDPRPDEPGVDWILGAQEHRACLRATEIAVVLANYIRLLGFDALAHTPTTTDFDLNQLCVAAGLASVENGELVNPWIGNRFCVAAISTTMELEPDRPLAPQARQPWFRTRGPAWWLGFDGAKSATSRDPYASRRYVDGSHPFEKLKRVDSPTTYIDEANVARVPKRTDMFARAQFGDMGKANQDNAAGGYYGRKSAPSMAQRYMLGAFVLLQDGTPSDGPRPDDAERNAANLKAASYWLGVDAVGLSRCPEWTWYSHDATGAVLDPPHDQSVSMIVDQGHETMEGASGDDWISVAQSMRAYLRFSLLGGVLAKQIRNLGYKAKAHSVLDGEVLQPPLLLLSGAWRGLAHRRGDPQSVPGPAPEVRRGDDGHAHGA